MGKPVVHFEIGAKDDQAMRQFYGDLFGWKAEVHEASGYGIVDTDSGGEGIGGGIFKTPSGEPFTAFYVQVDDVQSTLDAAEKPGGKTVMPPMQVPEGPEVAMFADPEGNSIGVVKMPG
jgi:uncharacterized protein